MSTPETTATGFVRVRQRGSGPPTYYAVVRLPDGRRVQRRLGPVWAKRSRPPAGHLTRKDAEARLAGMLRGDNPRVRTVAAVVTFRAAADEWLRYVEHDRRREVSTVLGYRRAVEHRLLPAFGNLALDEIDVWRCERWRSGMLREGLADATINMLRWMGEAIYRRAGRVWNVQANPFLSVERQPHRPSGDFNILSPEQTAALARHAVTEQDGVLFAVAAFTGLRLGELRALRWGDLDWGARLVHVRRSYTRDRFKVPKSGRVRSVPMIDQVVGPLDRLSRRALFTDPDNLVFVNDTGGVFEESAMRRRFYRSRDAAGLPPVRFHDLRHSYCSLAVRAYRLDEVKAYAGHADIAMTMRYVHFVPAHDAAERLSKVIAQATGAPDGAPNSRLAA